MNLKKKKGGFPDNNKDGKITQADIYLQKKKTGTIAKKGGVKKKKLMYIDGGTNPMMDGTFGEAFAAARKTGKTTCMLGGNSYNTKNKEERTRETSTTTIEDENVTMEK